MDKNQIEQAAEDFHRNKFDTLHLGVTCSNSLCATALADFAYELVQQAVKDLEDKRGVQIGGDTLSVSLNEFNRRAEILLADEQEKPLPDNALIAFLCDAVRLSREYSDSVKETGGWVKSAGEDGLKRIELEEQITTLRAELRQERARRRQVEWRYENQGKGVPDVKWSWTPEQWLENEPEP